MSRYLLGEEMIIELEEIKQQSIKKNPMDITYHAIFNKGKPSQLEITIFYFDRYNHWEVTTDNFHSPLNHCYCKNVASLKRLIHRELGKLEWTVTKTKMEVGE